MLLSLEGPESSLYRPFALPLVIAREIDVLAAKWGEASEQLRIYDVAVRG
jgi:hypothetical protein